VPRRTVEVAELSVVVPGRDAGKRSLRLAHISDLHFRRWDEVSREAQRLLLDLDYDVLVATGDFGNFRRHWKHAAELTKRFFGPLAERGEVFAVLGNHDDPRIAGSAGMPLTFLRNESRRIEVGNAGIRLAGVDQFTRGAERLDLALAEASADEPTILLAHYPSTVYRLPPGKVSLVLSGHTHGGQIRLPRLGCLWPNDRIPRRMARGLHAVGGTWLHVSPGVGTSLPLRVRINCPPEITLLTLGVPQARAEKVRTGRGEPANRSPKLIDTTLSHR